MWSQIRVATGVILGSWFIYIGIQHFVDPIWFEPIVPEILGWPRFWVWVSGIAEIIVGTLLIFPKTQRIGGLACATLLVILYWANLNMWVNNIAIGGRTYEPHWHIIRLVAQSALIVISVYIWRGMASENHQQD